MNLETISNTVALLVFLSLAATALNCALRSHKLFGYLKEKHFERWSYLTSVGDFGPGGMNSFRSIPYVYGEEDNDDPEIVRLKEVVKCSTLYMLMAFVAAPIVMIVTAIICEAIRVSGK